jgi:hypothetical protein
MTEVKGELTAELALKLTFIMWEDMAEKERQMGRKLDGFERFFFKAHWLEDRGFVDGFGVCNVHGCCLLCEYAANKECGCKGCLVDWSKNYSNTCCAQRNDKIDYELTPAKDFLEYMKTHVRKEIN